MKKTKEHLCFAIIFLFTVLLFLYPLASMKYSFLGGDNFVQFYPWSKAYSEHVKSFSLPFWNKTMQSGFPLIAEGQVGGFYPLNLAMFFLLPLNFAYNYSIILHFLLAGLFMYAYARKLGADSYGGYLSSLLFCFGSCFAGCFYNIISLKTLAWCPAVFLLMELYWDKEKKRYLLLASGVIFLQLLAGFIQLAAYNIFFYLVYFLCKVIGRKRAIKEIFLSIFFMLILPVFLSLPQLLLTSQLANFSQRQGASLGFALWNSFPPLGVLGLVFPYTMLFLRSNLYVGILSLLFVLLSLQRSKGDSQIRPIIWVFFISFLFALGRYNPLYVILLKISGFYSFRNPSKFLFFSGFALSAMSGYGFSRFFAEPESAANKKSLRIFRVILIIAALAFISVSATLMVFKKQILSFGEWYVRHFVSNMPYHRMSPDFYAHKLSNIYLALKEAFSFGNLFIRYSWGMLVLALSFSFIAAHKNKLRLLALLIILADILAFSYYGTGFRPNIKPFTALEPDAPQILSKIRTDNELFRVLPFNIREAKLPNWSLPNANMFFGIDSAASYTPLASKSYRERLEGLEIVDDSLGVRPAKEEALRGNLEWLRLLNVKYVISAQPLSGDFLTLQMREGGFYLYGVSGYSPRFFFSPDINGPCYPEDIEALSIVKYKDGYAEVEIITDKKGYLVFSEGYYPGWQVSSDGKPGELLKVKGLVQGVALSAGKHRVIFYYKPLFFSQR
jgi:hypothetical protein